MQYDTWDLQLPGIIRMCILLPKALLYLLHKIGRTRVAVSLIICLSRDVISCSAYKECSALVLLLHLQLGSWRVSADRKIVVHGVTNLE